MDTSRLGVLRCAVGPEPKIADFESKEVKKDRDGNTVYTVAVTVRQDGRRVSVIEIAVSGEPKGVVEGSEVRVTGLEAFAWAMGDRHGISFRAAAITPVPAPASSASAGKGGGA
ncbi:regulatory protein [Streptomyces malaysiensis]|uniref:Regulatory protein n=1 Tax=Streptomyces malaysiensis TaxID=92644 RepID=A0A7X5X705_STRMQ|nr:regulatory protein [Streptomyces malaysiensis]